MQGGPRNYSSRWIVGYGGCRGQFPMPHLTPHPTRTNPARPQETRLRRRSAAAVNHVVGQVQKGALGGAVGEDLESEHGLVAVV